MMNNYRKYITTGVGFTFLVVGITGVIFKFAFKNHLLGEIHGWIGLGMFAFALVHIFQNWKPLQNHLRDRRVWLLAVPIVLLVAVLAFAPMPAGANMNPREMMNRLSQANTKDLATALGKDVNTVFAAMKSDGLNAVGTDETVQQLAEQNHRPPEAVLPYFFK